MRVVRLQVNARRWGRADRGPAGSSTAYFLRHFADLKQHGLDSEVTVFESSDYVGGRSTVVWPWQDDPFATPDTDDEQPVELGASIFVEVRPVQGNQRIQLIIWTTGQQEPAQGGDRVQPDPR